MDPEPRDDGLNSVESQVDNNDPIPIKSEVDLESEFLPIYKALNSVLISSDSDDPASRARVQEHLEVVRTGFGILGKVIESDEIRRYSVLSRLSTLTQDTRYPFVSMMARQFLTERLEFIGGLIDPTNTSTEDNTQLFLVLTNLYDPFGNVSEYDMPLTAILKEHKDLIEALARNDEFRAPTILRRLLINGDSELRDFAKGAVYGIVYNPDVSEDTKINLMASILYTRTSREFIRCEPVVRREIELIISQYGVPAYEFYDRWKHSSQNWLGPRGSKEERNIVFANVLDANLRTMKMLEGMFPNQNVCKALYEEFGIACFARYPVEVLAEQYRNRDDNSLPYGVMLYPYSDHNGAFYRSEPVRKLHDDLDGRYHLRIVEAGDKVEISRQLRRAKRRYGPKHKISFAVIGGHGTANSIQFGVDMPDLFGQYKKDHHPSHLLTADLDDPRALKVGDYFEDNPTIVLNSCSTGFQDGIGQEICFTLGATVIAPDDVTAVADISVKFRKDGKPEFSCTYSNANQQVYSAGKSVRLPES